MDLCAELDQMNLKNKIFYLQIYIYIYIYIYTHAYVFVFLNRASMILKLKLTEEPRDVFLQLLSKDFQKSLLLEKRYGQYNLFVWLQDVYNLIHYVPIQRKHFYCC